MYVCVHVCVYVCMCCTPHSCQLPTQSLFFVASYYQSDIYLDIWVLKWSGTGTETDPRAGGNNLYGCKGTETDPRAGGNNLYSCKDGNNGATRTKGRILLCLIDFGRAKDTRLEAYSDLLKPCNNGSTTDTDSEVGMEVEGGTGTGTGRGMRAGTGGRKIPHDRGRDRGENGDRDGVSMKGMVRRKQNCYDRNEKEETKEEGEGGGVSGDVVSYIKSCTKNAFSYNVTVGHDRGMHLHCMYVLSFAICYNFELVLCNFPLLYVILLSTTIMLHIFLL